MNCLGLRRILLFEIFVTAIRKNERSYFLRHPVQNTVTKINSQ